MTRADDDLRSDVAEELRWDPRLDASGIAVLADDGKVTLRGTVPSPREKREARKAAERVFGVISIKNDLDVRVMNNLGREDAELRADILQALILDAQVPPTVDVEANEGIAKLTGTAQWNYQRQEAERVAAHVPGVVDVWNEILLTEPEEAVVAEDIERAFRRSAELDADDVSVRVIGSTVILDGVVHSWAEHDLAVDAAWAAPGVATVEDRLVLAG
jgi:osmotically-inducible protein OsmY